MIDNIKLISQSSIRIDNNGIIIYFDPFKIDNYSFDADYIFITHSHYDHFSKEDILKIKKDSTKIVVTNDLYDEVLKMGFSDILVVEPNNDYSIDNINFKTVPAYNIKKDFHKKEYNWVGYIININNKILYIAGDTDNIPEIRNIKCDIAFVPVGGTYTMDYKEASKLIDEMKPKLAVPIHYKTVIGSVEDAYNFKKELEGKIEVTILMK